MAYFAAILEMKQKELNDLYRPQHLEFLKQLEKEGKVYKKGPFLDGSGGLVIYIADNYDEAKLLAEQDPYIIYGVRSLDLRQWGIV
ncbi:YciI family protein [Alkalihalobacterium bogoriense]|uniref:YciI family protein n=1 Tax=Alkalihalobacterium bogoriense TaxID=246272 RepID=UPI00047B1960|nr:YciI family protein [Alkalihalobacterium bogoriense]